MEIYTCPHFDCNATMQGKGKYEKHFQTHKKPFRYQCKHLGCGKEYYIKSSFYSHKKSCQHKPQNPREGNPQLEHILADTRNHHTAGQSSASQQDHSNDEYPSEKFNILDYPDDDIFNYLNIPDDVVVNIEDINIDNSNDSAEGNPQLGHTLADTRNHHIAGQGLAAQQDRSSGGYPPENFNIFDVLTLTILTSSTMLTSPTTSKYFGTSENCLLAVY
uniref:C2H2-type domain-containing protein n=1 Tax=Loa loa TaxID=7209 RepID=A0A1I7V6T1_LOALO